MQTYKLIASNRSTTFWLLGARGCNPFSSSIQQTFQTSVRHRLLSSHFQCEDPLLFFFKLTLASNTDLITNKILLSTVLTAISRKHTNAIFGDLKAYAQEQAQTASDGNIPDRILCLLRSLSSAFVLIPTDASFCLDVFRSCAYAVAAIPDYVAALPEHDTEYANFPTCKTSLTSPTFKDYIQKLLAYHPNLHSEVKAIFPEQPLPSIAPKDNPLSLKDEPLSTDAKSMHDYCFFIQHSTQELTSENLTVGIKLLTDLLKRNFHQVDSLFQTLIDVCNVLSRNDEYGDLFFDRLFRVLRPIRLRNPASFGFYFRWRLQEPINDSFEKNFTFHLSRFIRVNPIEGTLYLVQGLEKLAFAQSSLELFTINSDDLSYLHIGDASIADRALRLLDTSPTLPKNIQHYLAIALLPYCYS